MLEFLTTPEFAGWFEALPDEYAEEVASAIDLLAACPVPETGPGPEHGSTLILWYEHEHACRFRLHLLEHLQDMQYARDLSAHLGSSKLQDRFGRLAVADSNRVLRLLALFQAQARAQSIKFHLSPSSEVNELLRRAAGEIYALLGHVAEPDPSALRELQITARESRFRVLFGADWSRGEGLLVLGEALDREFYGDSVRSALRSWNRFRAGERDAFQPAEVHR